MNRVWTAVIGLAVGGSLLLDLLRPTRGEYLWDLPFFFAVFGFVGCVVLTYGAKWLGKYLVQREPDYYDPFRAPDEVGEPGAAAAEGRGEAGDG